MTRHVVHVLSSFDTGGLQQGVVNLVNHSDPARFRHSIVSFSPALGMRERLRRDDVQVESIALGGLGRLAAARRLAARLRALGCDVLHTRNRGTQLDGALAGVIARVPWRVHGYHGRDLGNASGERLARRLVGRVAEWAHHRVIALTPAMREEYRRDYGVPARKIAVIPNGVDLERLNAFAPAEALRSPFTVATVGRLDAVKNLPLLLRAFAAMENRGPEDRLVIAGDGPERPRLEALATELALPEGAIRFLGERKDAPAVMKAADLYVQPSFYEGMSNTIVEAMALGVPVLATEVGGNADVTGREGAARLVPSDDVAAMRMALEAFRADPELRRETARRGRERVEGRFTLERMVTAYEAVWSRNGTE
ncbi:MAG: glycosyltransferase [Planctomycetota bacterium]